MNKIDKQNLDGMIRTINRSIVISFLIIVVFFIIIINIVFVKYKKHEDELISQKLDTTFSFFINKISQQLIAITMLTDFRDYLHSGWLSRVNKYKLFFIENHYSNLSNAVIGMDILDKYKKSIFSYGIKTSDSVTLDLCYLNRGLLNFYAGNCSHKWVLYFKRDAIIEELKKLNPELIDCNNCSKKIVTGRYFGDFPMSQFSGMEVNLNIKNSPLMILWEIIFFIVGSLLFLVIWNVNRIKSIFKKYLSDPISDITLKIKENKPLPSIVVEELAYLTEQIVELGKIKTQEKIKEEKTKIMQSIGASIAHELRTPLRSMISGVSGIEKFLPALLNGYDLAKKANLVTTVIGPQQIELLHKVLSNLKTEGTSANMVVDMLLMKIRGTITAVSDAKELSISECLDEALQRYGFQEAERNLIIYDTVSDFWFEGNKLLVVHVLFNLLKNALYYIASGQQGQIYISFECGKNENILHFKDTGKGIAKEVLPHIFDRFYSKTEGGTGIGLSFCKMAMEWMGGDITCQSIEGEYTEFVLHFPVHK